MQFNQAPGNGQFETESERFYEIDHRPIDAFKVPSYYFRSTPSEQEIKDRAQSLINSGSLPTIIAISEPGPDDKHEILDGIINWYAMKHNGVHMVNVEWKDYAVEDRPFQMVQFNHRKYITHQELALILPVLDEWYDRHPDERVGVRKSEFVQQQFKLLGFMQMGKTNVDKFREICASPDRGRLLLMLDSARRQFESTYKLMKSTAASDKDDDENRVKPPAPDDNTDDDDSDNQDTTNYCTPVAVDKLVPISITVNGQTINVHAGDFCGECIIHRFTMNAVTGIKPAEEGS